MMRIQIPQKVVVSARCLLAVFLGAICTFLVHEGGHFIVGTWLGYRIDFYLDHVVIHAISSVEDLEIISVCGNIALMIVGIPLLLIYWRINQKYDPRGNIIYLLGIVSSMIMTLLCCILIGYWK